MSSQNANVNNDADEETIKEFEDEDEIGEYTADLSTVTESEESMPFIRRALTIFTEFACAKSGRQSRLHRLSKARFYKMSAELKQTWKDVCWMTLYLNFLVLFSCAICTMVRVTTVSHQIVEKYGNTSECMYTWAEWGPCSQKCRNGSSLPYRIRRVASFSVLDMTTLSPYESIFKKLFQMWNSDIGSQCYKHVQYAPCNVLQCPTNLSTIQFGICEYTDIRANMKENVPCKKFLNFTKNSLIFVDDAYKNLTKECSCPEAVYPF